MKKNNKGFSLVELIIVIAIMAVLVGVLAPQFIKYVEQSRRSRDISTAQEIRESVLAAIADGRLTGSATQTSKKLGTDISIGSNGSVDTISEVPKVAGNAAITPGGDFTINYNPSSGVCDVYVGSYCLTNESWASAYKAKS